MDDWELVKQFFWIRVFESPLSSVPACTFEVKSMDVHTFLWRRDGLALNSTVISLNDFLDDIGGVLDVIE